MPKSLIFHIGLPKTATTFLQHRAFKGTPGLGYMHRLIDHELNFCKPLENAINTAKPVPPGAKKKISRWLDQKGPLLISDEVLCMRAREFWSDEGPDPAYVAKRLWNLQRLYDKKLRMSVVIGLRRQDQWLASWYAHTSQRFTEFDQADFDRRMAMLASDSARPAWARWLQYDRVLADFEAVFGPKRVFLYSIEAVGENPKDVLGELGEFCGADFQATYRKSLEKGQNLRLNEKSAGANEWRLPGSGATLRMSPETIRAIMDTFRASNEALTRTDVFKRQSVSLVPYT